MSVTIPSLPDNTKQKYEDLVGEFAKNYNPSSTDQTNGVIGDKKQRAYFDKLYRALMFTRRFVTKDALTTSARISITEIVNIFIKNSLQSFIPALISSDDSSWQTKTLLGFIFSFSDFVGTVSTQVLSRVLENNASFLYENAIDLPNQLASGKFIQNGVNKLTAFYANVLSLLKDSISKVSQSIQRGLDTVTKQENLLTSLQIVYDSFVGTIGELGANVNLAIRESISNASEYSAVVFETVAKDFKSNLIKFAKNMTTGTIGSLFTIKILGAIDRMSKPIIESSTESILSSSVFPISSGALSVTGRVIINVAVYIGWNLIGRTLTNAVVDGVLESSLRLILPKNYFRIYVSSILRSRHDMTLYNLVRKSSNYAVLGEEGCAMIFQKLKDSLSNMFNNVGGLAKRRLIHDDVKTSKLSIKGMSILFLTSIGPSQLSFASSSIFQFLSKIPVSGVSNIAASIASAFGSPVPDVIDLGAQITSIHQSNVGKTSNVEALLALWYDEVRADMHKKFTSTHNEVERMQQAHSSLFTVDLQFEDDDEDGKALMNTLIKTGVAKRFKSTGLNAILKKYGIIQQNLGSESAPSYFADLLDYVESVRTANAYNENSYYLDENELRRLPSDEIENLIVDLTSCLSFKRTIFNFMNTTLYRTAAFSVESVTLNQSQHYFAQLIGFLPSQSSLDMDTSVSRFSGVGFRHRTSNKQLYEMYQKWLLGNGNPPVSSNLLGYGAVHGVYSMRKYDLLYNLVSSKLASSDRILSWLKNTSSLSTCDAFSFPITINSSNTIEAFKDDLVRSSIRFNLPRGDQPEPRCRMSFSTLLSMELSCRCIFKILHNANKSLSNNSEINSNYIDSVLNPKVGRYGQINETLKRLISSNEIATSSAEVVVLLRESFYSNNVCDAKGLDAIIDAAKSFMAETQSSLSTITTSLQSGSAKMEDELVRAVTSGIKQYDLNFQQMCQLVSDIWFSLSTDDGVKIDARSNRLSKAYIIKLQSSLDEFTKQETLLYSSKPSTSQPSIEKDDDEMLTDGYEFDAIETSSLAIVEVLVKWMEDVIVPLSSSLSLDFSTSSPNVKYLDTMSEIFKKGKRDDDGNTLSKAKYSRDCSVILTIYIVFLSRRFMRRDSKVVNVVPSLIPFNLVEWLSSQDAFSMLLRNLPSFSKGSLWSKVTSYSSSIPDMLKYWSEYIDFVMKSGELNRRTDYEFWSVNAFSNNFKSNTVKNIKSALKSNIPETLGLANRGLNFSAEEFDWSSSTASITNYTPLLEIARKFTSQVATDEKDSQTEKDGKSLLDSMKSSGIDLNLEELQKSGGLCDGYRRFILDTLWSNSLSGSFNISLVDALDGGLSHSSRLSLIIDSLKRDKQRIDKMVGYLLSGKIKNVAVEYARYMRPGTTFIATKLPQTTSTVLGANNDIWDSVQWPNLDSILYSKRSVFDQIGDASLFSTLSDPSSPLQTVGKPSNDNPDSITIVDIPENPLSAFYLQNQTKRDRVRTIIKSLKSLSILPYSGLYKSAVDLLYQLSSKSAILPLGSIDDSSYVLDANVSCSIDLRNTSLLCQRSILESGRMAEIYSGLQSADQLVGEMKIEIEALYSGATGAFSSLQYTPFNYVKESDTSVQLSGPKIISGVSELIPNMAINYLGYAVYVQFAAMVFYKRLEIFFLISLFTKVAGNVLSSFLSWIKSKFFTGPSNKDAPKNKESGLLSASAKNNIVTLSDISLKRLLPTYGNVSNGPYQGSIHLNQLCKLPLSLPDDQKKKLTPPKEDKEVENKPSTYDKPDGGDVAFIANFDPVIKELETVSREYLQADHKPQEIPIDVKNTTTTQGMTPILQRIGIQSISSLELYDKKKSNILFSSGVETPMSLFELVGVLKDAAAGIAYLDSRGKVHGNINTESLYFDRDNLKGLIGEYGSMRSRFSDGFNEVDAQSGSSDQVGSKDIRDFGRMVSNIISTHDTYGSFSADYDYMKVATVGTYYTKATLDSLSEIERLNLIFSPNAINIDLINDSVSDLSGEKKETLRPYSVPKNRTFIGVNNAKKVIGVLRTVANKSLTSTGDGKFSALDLFLNMNELYSFISLQLELLFPSRNITAPDIVMQPQVWLNSLVSLLPTNEMGDFPNPDIFVTPIVISLFTLNTAIKSNVISQITSNLDSVPDWLRYLSFLQPQRFIGDAIRKTASSLGNLVRSIPEIGQKSSTTEFGSILENAEDAVSFTTADYIPSDTFIPASDVDINITQGDMSQMADSVIKEILVGTEKNETVTYKNPLEDTFEFIRQAADTISAYGILVSLLPEDESESKTK